MREGKGKREVTSWHWGKDAPGIGISNKSPQFFAASQPTVEGGGIGGKESIGMGGGRKKDLAGGREVTKHGTA